MQNNRLEFVSLPKPQEEPFSKFEKSEEIPEGEVNALGIKYFIGLSFFLAPNTTAALHQAQKGHFERGLNACRWRHIEFTISLVGSFSESLPQTLSNQIRTI